MLLRVLFVLVVLICTVPGPARAVDGANSMAAALAAMRTGAWDEAATLARRAGGVAPAIIEWHRLRAGRGTFAEAQSFLSQHGDWPGLPFLRQKSEESVPIGGPADAVVRFFAGNPPQTGHGAVALVTAYGQSGLEGDAQAEAVLAWLTLQLDTTSEAALLARHGDLLAGMHEARLDMLLWRGLQVPAERMMVRVNDGWRRLAEARLALRLDRPGVDALIEAVPAAFADDPGLAYERFAWRDKRGRDADAASLMLERSPDRLGRPEVWSDRRRTLARAEMRAGRADRAYALAAHHGLVEGSDYADLEWLAGFVALEDLDDPELARFHFRRFRLAVTSPISLGRAGYWLGRAEEALGNAEAARAAYAFGAEHQTSFYGQLAAERAGLPMEPTLVGTEVYPDWESLPAAGSSVAQAAELLFAAGETTLGARFMAHLAESLPQEQKGALADRALALDEPYAALSVAKLAAQSGEVLPRAYFPVIDMGLDRLPIPRELALAIARRELEFNPRVISPVGARGLMQLMPGTARLVSRRLGVGYSEQRLLSDPAYNAHLGSAYLAGLIEQFGRSIPLVASGYNAGPGRPSRWIELYGDPRRPGADVVDWIEHIPFRETRNYVMRVAESMPIYRARLSGQAGSIGLTSDLTGR